MEKQILSQIEQYLSKYKSDIQTKLIDLQFTEKEKASELIEYIFEYERFVFDKSNIAKKKKQNTSEKQQPQPQHPSSSNLNEEEKTIEETSEIETEPSHPSSKKSQTSTSTTAPLTDAERCISIRKQGDRCTRKRVQNSCYCGTHQYIQQRKKEKKQDKKEEEPEPGTETGTETEIRNTKEVVAHDIQGIIYYIDEDLNVYDTDDIFKNVVNPRIIAKAVHLGGNDYTIPSLMLM